MSNINDNTASPAASAADVMTDEERVDQLLEGIELDTPEWAGRLYQECPFCAAPLEYTTQSDPDVVNFHCGCGFNGFIMGPRDQRDPRYVTESEHMIDELEEALENEEAEGE